MSYEDAKTFADENGMEYFETSSKTGEGVTELFERVALKVLELPPPSSQGL